MNAIIPVADNDREMRHDGARAAIPMDEPEIDREYCFVRIRNGNVEWAKLTRFADGSAYVVDANHERIFEERDDAWNIALNWLKSEGFVTQHEAIQRLIIPASWTQPN